MGFLPFFPQLGETIPFISWTQVFSADQAVHSWWVQQEAQGPSVCFLQPLQQSLRGTALHSLLSLSIPGKRKGLGGFLPIPTADYGCYNLYRLTVAFHNTPCHHWPLTEQSRDWGDDRNLSGGSFVLWHRVGVVALPHAKLTHYHSSTCYTLQFAVLCFVTGKTDT